jgi:hypothetical protein
MRTPYNYDKGGLPERSEASVTSGIAAYLPAAVGRSLKDEFKIAAIVSMLRIAGCQAMRSSGTLDRLQILKAHVTKNNSKLSSVISSASRFFSYAGRPLAHALVEYVLHDHEHYERYTSQPNSPEARFVSKID